MSKIIEDASIINSVNGKPLLRSSVFCKSILISFFKELQVISDKENAIYSVNQDLINKMQYDIVKNLATRWLEITDGR
jgi:diphthamide biosynthesis methyltransferase